MISYESNYSLSESDKAELEKLVSVMELSSGTTIIFAIAPESSPQHPVVKKLQECLETSEEHFQYENFFYSQNSFHNFLYSLDDSQQQNSQEERKLVMAFGLDQLPTPRLVIEMQRLNLGREELFGRNLVLIFWLNKSQFLDEFRHRAPDFWDWREKVVQFETRNPLLYPYLEWLIADNSYLKMSGVMQVNRQVDIFLDQIYVSLQAQRRQEITETFERSEREFESMTGDSSRLKMMGTSLDDWDEPGYYDYEPPSQKFVSVSSAHSSARTVIQKVDLSEAVRKHSYSVILGAPGAGKTTLLRYLALHYATAKRDNQETVIVDEEKKELGKTLLPIFFRIADYAERLKQQPELTLREYLRQFYREWEADFQAQEEVGTEVTELLLDAMHQGQCLMLLDGLDEVFDQKSREHIVEHINQFVEEFPANKFVITSRIAGYRDVQLSSRFAEFTIEDMDGEQVERFLYRWCRVIEEAQQPDAGEEQWQRRGDEQAQDILKAIEDNEGVKRLTANPLLLTILALIHRNGERLPNRRVKLYELAVQTLTEDWQLGKKLPDAPRVMLKESEVVQLLAPLAYWMHETKPSGLVTQAEVEEKLATELAEINDAEPESDSIRQAVAEFLRKVRETTGLFVERMPGVYGFMHLTFEEYFAARHIADNDQSEILRLIQEHLHEPRWNEPILLALGYYGDNFPSQVKKLIDNLFKIINLEDYEPVLQHGEIKIKSFSPDDVKLVWLKAEDESASNLRQLEFQLKDLLFAGKVIAEVEVNSSSLRKKIIRKLVLTYLGVDADFEDDITKELLRLLRKIELFNQKNEVIEFLRQKANDSTLSEEIRVKAKTALFYVACVELAELVNCATEIVHQLEPSLFCSIADLMAELGEEITPALEAYQQRYSHDAVCQKALTFLTAMSYLRKDKYDKASDIFGEREEELDSSLRPFVCWALAKCYEEKEEYEKADGYYNRSKMADYPQQNTLFIFWRHWGWCQRLDKKYEQSLVYYQKALAVAKELLNSQYESSIFYNIGRVYQDWGKYEQAITYYQQSKELDQQLGRDKDVANMWYWLGDCYREWGKYEQAIECQNQALAIRQQLYDQVGIASAYFRLGKIYQGWGKYEQAISSYQQSQERYQHLGRDKDVANLWYWQGDCYREWGKYSQALECENQDLVIRQQLDDRASIANAYNQLGRIYQGWGKYEQAINYYQQSKELYQQLGRERNVAYQWYRLGDCHREWGKYSQALECENQHLTICQQLDGQVNIAGAYYQLGRIYQGWEKYEQAINYYQQSKELNQHLGRDKDVAGLWNWLAICYREWGKYGQAVECENQDLIICQQLDDQVNIAGAYYQLGRVSQGWSKYEQAINYYQQSREIHQQLGRDKGVADQWYRLAICYREWGKYGQAVECENQDLAIRRQLDDQVGIADGYYQLGRIYQGWSKYEQAINYYQQSREIHQHLGRNKSVVNQWYWMADCYREWGKYEQAIECQNQDLVIHQQLDDQVGIADGYYQLGRIYQGWEKYEQAIHYHQQSKEGYQQLGRDKNVANQWYCMAVCYREWGKYEQALECENQDLAIRQQLDDQVGIADVFLVLAWIYQGWSKYEQAINYYQQSREIHQQLGRDKGVADQWYRLAICYREWGKYGQAVECENQDLAIRRQLDDQVGIADSYYQLGRIYQGWSKYEQAINYYQQSREIHQHLGRNKSVANKWYWMADCYREWGKYGQAIECENQDLAIRRQLDDQVGIADGYYQLGRIYQGWSKYEQAINYYQQSREIHQQLGRNKSVANQWYWMADCYSEWGKYEQAIECENQDLAIRQQLDDQVNIADAYYQLGIIYQEWNKYEQAINSYQQSKEAYQQLGRDNNVAQTFRRLGYAQTLLAKTYQDHVVALNLLTQAENNIHQAIQLNTTGDYKDNLAYDYTILGLLYSKRLSLLPSDNSLIQEQVVLFEQCYHTALTYLTELGETVDRANEALDMARAYLEVEVLENLNRAEEIAQECLQIFQEYNRRKREAAALKLLGEIYQKRTQQNQPDAEPIATQFLSESLQIYRELDLQKEAVEVKQLMHPSNP
ncbi:tetratricopeptide repeat protein [Scytonema sp. PRP1]|uniref:tetratricopeptide repeat protein n=1 Tax=Scytonema sp. PRP1 TaxID=3120513 RepID=UPI00300C5002